MEQHILDELKAILFSEKKRLETELASFAKKTGNTEDYNTKWEDYGDDEDENAAEVAAYTDSLGLEQTFESELSDVNAALKRMDDGTYGVCTLCGNQIEEKRLVVRPQSALCMACIGKK